MQDNYQICSYCVMDTTDHEIVFDQEGVCNHCKNAKIKLEKVHFGNDNKKAEELNKIVDQLKKEGKGKKYDCIIGLSGGVDSSYLAYYLVKHLGLRPLAVHVDNGWNSELAVQNIETLVKKLNIDLHTWVINWDEFKDLQKAFLKASVVDLEMLTDNAIVIAIYKLKKKYKIKTFVDGTNFETESIMPLSWYFSTKYDSLNIRSIYKQFGSGKKLKSFPLLSTFEYIKYRYFKKGRSIGLLNFIDYNKSEVKDILINKLKWRDYGGKHFESRITQFYQAFILPQKFNIDKRKAHLSSLIVSNQTTRDAALKELKNSPYKGHSLDNDKEFFLKKLDLTESEFKEILKTKPIPHLHYSAYSNYHNKLIQLKQKFY